MGYNDAPDGWWQEFVSASPARTAKLAVTRLDGSPHVAPVWVALDGDEIVFMTSADTVKGKSILRDGRVALCWDDERPPLLLPHDQWNGDDQHRPRRVAPLGHRDRWSVHEDDLAEQYGRRNAVPPEMVINVTPSKVVAKVDVAD